MRQIWSLLWEVIDRADILKFPEGQVEHQEMKQNKIITFCYDEEVDPSVPPGLTHSHTLLPKIV